MLSLKPAFDRAIVTDYGLSPLAIMFWTVAIDEDRQRHEKERRRKQQAAVQPRRKSSPHAGPRPF